MIEANKNTEELHTDFKKAQETKVDDIPVEPKTNQSTVAVTSKNTLRATRSKDVSSQASSTTWLGTTISFDPNGSGYFVGNKGYGTMNEARAAIEKSVGMTINEARRAIRSANEDE